MKQFGIISYTLAYPSDAYVHPMYTTIHPSLLTVQREGRMDAAVSEGLSVARLVSRLVSLGMCRGSSATNLVHRSYLPLRNETLVS